MGLQLERLGIAEEREAIRLKYARFAYKAPSMAAKEHRITVDLKANTRTVERVGPAPAVKIERPEPVHRPEPPPPPEPVVSTSPSKPTIRAVQIAFLEAYYEAGGRAKDDAVYTMNHLCGARRPYEISHPRQVCMALVREITKAPLPGIGKAFGNKDHTTVMCACKRAPAHVAAYPILAIVQTVVRARFGVEQ